MDECEGEKCTSERAGKLSEPESGILLAAHAADIRALAVLCTRWARGSVPGEREARQRSGFSGD